MGVLASSSCVRKHNEKVEMTHRMMFLAFFSLLFFPTPKNLLELNQFSVEKGKNQKTSNDLIMLYVTIVGRKCCVLGEYFVPSLLDF